MQVGGRSVEKFSSDYFYFLHEVSEEKGGGDRGWKREKLKIAVREGGRLHRTKEMQAYWWSAQKVFEGMNLSETSQPGDVFFPATFSCVGAGWRGQGGEVFTR